MRTRLHMAAMMAALSSSASVALMPDKETLLPKPGKPRFDNEARIIAAEAKRHRKAVKRNAIKKQARNPQQGKVEQK